MKRTIAFADTDGRGYETSIRREVTFTTPSTGHVVINNVTYACSALAELDMRSYNVMLVVLPAGTDIQKVLGNGRKDKWKAY